VSRRNKTSENASEMRENTTPVERIVWHQTSQEQVVDWKVDWSRPIYVNPYVLSLQGWIVGNKRRIQRVALFFDSKEVARAKLGLERADVRTELKQNLSKFDCLVMDAKILLRKAVNRLGVEFIRNSRLFERVTHSKYYHSGFRIDCNLLGCPSRCKLDLVAFTSHGDRIPLCEIHISRPKLKASLWGRVPKFQPLMVTSLGRSGSTWMMHLLSQHPNIVVIKKYPYEVVLARRIFEKALERILLISSGKLDIEKFFAENISSSNQDWGGALPKPSLSQEASQLLEQEINTVIRNAIQEIDCFYSHVSMYYDDKRSLAGSLKSPRYFAEKNLAPEWLFWEVYPGAKEIFLVRDFRDMICSSIVFGKRKGFGREKVATDEAFCYYRASMARPWILEPYKRRSSYAHLVRYEDLISDPQKSLKNILDYLDLDSDKEVIDTMLKNAQKSSKSFRSHITAESPKSSIGRWKRDMSQDLQRACCKAFQEFFEMFGYKM